MAEQPEPKPGCPSCAELSRKVAELQAIVNALGAQISKLKARNVSTSRTSSKPPSSDTSWTRQARRKKAPSSKKRGGQPGHEGKTREQAPLEDLDDVKIVRPDTCSTCGEPLVGDDPCPRIHQVIDIPHVDPLVIEYRMYQLVCAKCSNSTKATLPQGVPESQFGPNLSALVALLTGGYRMSRRNVQRFIADTYGINISLGALSGIEGRICEGLAESYADARASVEASPVKHLDETSWSESNVPMWVWVGVGDSATVFMIRPTRGSVVAREMIGDEPTGVVVTDRYSGYSYIDIEQRQVCLAHLIRDFRRMSEGEPNLRWIGERLLGLTEALFRIWRGHQANEIDRVHLVRWARNIRTRMVRLLEVGARSVGWKTPSLCRGILDTEAAIWTFTEQGGVSPTNNAAEQAIRPAVISRKTSFGTQSDRGSRYLERMLTCAATLKRAGRSLHEFIVGVARAMVAGTPLPTLLR